ncbi:MAG: AAA family ATPase [Desulfovibrio sp.]|nr:AAA family ATPase [Desulfovibrio sp.]
MQRILATGKQSFEKLRTYNCFYVDKTKFIREWWNTQDDVTLITRPRRFGKTLMLDTVKTFFSQEFADRSDLFEGLEISKDEKFRNIKGAIPVIFLSFAEIKENTFNNTVSLIKEVLTSVYRHFKRQFDIASFSDWEKELFDSIHNGMSDVTVKRSIHYLSEFLTYRYKRNPIILLDEYDAPLQNAWVYGFWKELVDFLRGFFNSTFKTNPFLERGLITGVTRLAKESIFSDMNNLKVVTTTTNCYTDCFGFTEEEVFLAMNEYGLQEKEDVKKWYDGFIFGKQKNIYNPWSILEYLSEKKFSTYWADTSSNELVSQLVAQSDEEVKDHMFTLLKGEPIITKIDEQIVFSQLYDRQDAIWSFLMASGYLKPLSNDNDTGEYKVAVTNYEVLQILKRLISSWFNNYSVNAEKFRRALLIDDIVYMNKFLRKIAINTFSFFDTSGDEPERFYHAFVLGLTVDLQDQYEILSNRESGFGRYDITMFPKRSRYHGIVIEFKTLERERENNLQDACNNALLQIKTKKYSSSLLSRGVASSNIYVYGFAFKGKDLLICGGAEEKIDWTSLLGEK